MTTLVITLKLHNQMDKNPLLVVVLIVRYRIANCQAAIDVVISKINLEFVSYTKRWWIVHDKSIKHDFGFFEFFMRVFPIKKKSSTAAKEIF